MKFHETVLEDALGTKLAHTTQAGDVKLKKGHMLTAADLQALQAAGFERVTAVRLEQGDIEENEAAARIAAQLTMTGIRIGEASTGRVNFHAETGGIFTVDAGLIDAINAVDDTVTIATVKPFERVKEGQIVATIKIIPFAITQPAMTAVTEIARRRSAFHVRPFAGLNLGLVQTTLPTLKETVLDKTRQTLEARISANHGVLTAELRTAHDSGGVSAAIRKLCDGNDIVLVFGASAVVDSADVIPSAIRQAGGAVHHIGMPVDPGNLLILGEANGKIVIGAPGCARSPKENGFDWVLDRLMANLPVNKSDIIAMGVGGLLMEIPARPQLRDPQHSKAPAKIAIALLAAGPVDQPEARQRTSDALPLRRLAMTAIEAGGSPVIAVLGHLASTAADELAGLDIVMARNEAHRSGLASSLQCAVRHLPSSAGGLMVVLAGRPSLSADQLKRLMAAFQDRGGRCVVRATIGGKRSNPVILPRIMFDELFTLSGDVGARHLIERGDIPVIELEMGAVRPFDLDMLLENSGTSL